MPTSQGPLRAAFPASNELVGINTPIASPDKALVIMLRARPPENARACFLNSTHVAVSKLEQFFRSYQV